MTGPKSEEHRQKLIAHMREVHQRKRGTKGLIKHSEETKKKIGIANSKRIWKDESRQKISNFRKQYYEKTR